MTSAGKDGVFGTKDDVKIAVRRATYNAQRKTVTLAFNRRLYLFQTYQVRINSTAVNGLMDTSGRLPRRGRRRQTRRRLPRPIQP